VAIPFRVLEADLAHGAQVDELDDLLGELATQDVVPFLPTQMILTVLPSAMSRLAWSRARRAMRS
jgi:hypothetical protein